MPELFFLGLEVGERLVPGVWGARHAFRDSDARALKRVDLCRVVGQQPYSAQAKISQDLYCEPVLALVGPEDPYSRSSAPKPS